MQIRPRIVARGVGKRRSTRFFLQEPVSSAEALKCMTAIAANHKETFTIMHMDVSRAYSHAKAQRPVLVRLPVGGQSRAQMLQKLDS